MKGLHSNVPRYFRKMFFICGVLLLSLLFSFASLAHASKLQETAESRKLKEFAPYAKREGSTLYLKLRDGSYHALVDEPECAGWNTCREYELRDYFSDAGFYVVYLFSGEIEEFMLISDINAEITWVYTHTLVSPDNKRFVSFTAGSDFYPGGVMVGRFDGSKVLIVMNYADTGYDEYGFAAWLDNETIQLTKSTLSDAKYCPETRRMIVPVTLKLTQDAWGLTEELSPDAVKCVPDEVAINPRFYNSPDELPRLK